MWRFPCREVYFSFGKGWKTIWVVYYFRHILHSCSPSEEEVALSHFCNTLVPLFWVTFDQTRGRRPLANANTSSHKAVLSYTWRSTPPSRISGFSVILLNSILPQAFSAFLTSCLPPGDIFWSLHCTFLLISGAQITFSSVCVVSGNELGKGR